MQKDIKKLLSLFEVLHDYKEDTDYISFTLEAIKENSPEYKALGDMITDTIGDLHSKYYAVYSALEFIASNMENKTYEDLLDLDNKFADSVCDVYNDNLAQWLAKSTDNGEYVTNVLQEMDEVRDVYQAIKIAQHNFYVGIYLQILDYVFIK